MGINTGQIVSQARRSCSNAINLFTFIFSVLVFFSLSLIETQYYIEYFIWSVYSFYVIQLSLSISKVNTNVQQIDLNSSGENNPGIRIVNDNNNTVNIGQSLLNFKKLFVNNFSICFFIIVLEVVLNVLMFQLMEYVMENQIKIMNQIVGKASKGIKDKKFSIQQQEYQQLFYSRLLTEMTNVDMKTLKKMNHYVYLFVFSFMLNTFINVFITWLKYSALGQVQKRQIYRQTLAKASNLQNKLPTQNQHIPLIIQKHKISNVTIWESIKLTLSTLLRFSTITAYVRINLRLVIILYFLKFLTPFYYICIGFLYQRVSKSEFLVLIENLTFIQQKINIQMPVPKPSQNQNEKENTSQQYPFSENNQNRIYNQKVKEQQKVREIKKFDNVSQMISQINANNQQNMGLVKQQKAQQSLSLRQKQTNQFTQKIYSILKNNTKQKPKHTMLKKKTKKASNNITKLVYRPYFNDVVAVRKFK